MKFLVLFFIQCLAHSQSVSMEETIDDLPAKSNQTTQGSSSSVRQISGSKRQKIGIEHVPESGNLPGYARRSKQPDEIVNPSKNAANNDFKSNVNLKMGDIFHGMINQSIVAYPDSNAPVSARILDGKYRGGLALGFASLDRSTKRVNVTFHSIRLDESSSPFDFNAVVQANDGQLGLEGKYESYYWEYFWAETLANTVSGFANATTQKSQTAWGGFIPNPNPSDAAKQGIANGLSKTADALAERQRSLPEMTTVTGPTLVQITIVK